MKCAIMQPTYLPWAGYFNLISMVDCFVFLDDVQFEKQSWQSRNRILLQGSQHLLAVPIEKAALSTVINKIKISERRGNWRRKHWMTLVSAYRKALFGKQLLELLEPFYNSDYNETNLSCLNQNIIKGIAQSLGINTCFINASSMCISGERTIRLISICKKLMANIYLSPLGSTNYLEADGFSEQREVALEFQSFTPYPYVQYGAIEYISHLSIVDVIANIGMDNARKYIMGLQP